MALPPDYLRRIRVFIASPRDMSTERKIFRDAIEKVNRIKAKPQGVLLEPVGWEDTLPGKSRPQEKINDDIKKSHLIVMLLWKRWGSPTGKYSSGFEEEYQVASAHDKDILFYFRDIPDDILEDPGEQVKKVLNFQKKIETEREFLFRNYKDEHIWKEQFIDDLSQWLDNIPQLTKGKILLPVAPEQTFKPRVYDEEKQPPIGSAHLPSYRWDAQNFERLYFDLQTGTPAEILEIGGSFGAVLNTILDHNRRIIPANTLVYRTLKRKKPLKAVGFGIEYAAELLRVFPDGQYNILSWQGQPYITIKGKANKLSKLIIEQGSAEKKFLTVGETWDIGDGWTLTAQSIDARATPRQVWFVLSKDGIKLDDRVIAEGQAYVYIEKSFAGEIDVPLFVTYTDSIFAGSTSDMVQLRYTWAISTSVTEIIAGDKFGKMEVITATSENLILRNKDEPINLIDSTVDIMGNLKFKVADDPNFLRFFPTIL
ncbi:MAG: S-layer protein domain-containing protein [Candidatus Methanoperedens sp.]